MNEEEKNAILYRFEGYQLPKIQLDETGDAYVVLHPHPYYYNQPKYWEKPAYLENHLIEPDIVNSSDIRGPNKPESTYGEDGAIETGQGTNVFPMLPL